MGEALEEGRWAMASAKARFARRDAARAPAAVLLRPAPRAVDARRRVVAAVRRAADGPGVRGGRAPPGGGHRPADPRGGVARAARAVLAGRPGLRAVRRRLLRRLRRRAVPRAADRLHARQRLGRADGLRRLRRRGRGRTAATSVAATGAATSAAGATSAAATSGAAATSERRLGWRACAPPCSASRSTPTWRPPRRRCCCAARSGPFALIGAWAGGGALLGSRPVRVAAPGADLFALLDDQPEVIVPAADGPPAAPATRIVGGGWVGFFGFELRHAVERGHPPPPRPIAVPDGDLAFYDHLLRVRRRGPLVVRGARDARARGGDPRAPRRAGRPARRPAAPAAVRDERLGLDALARRPRPRRRRLRRADRGRRPLPGQPLHPARRPAHRATRSTSSRPPRRRCPPIGPRSSRGRGGRWRACRRSSSSRGAAASVRSEPIKGTRPADRRAELEASAKDRAENVMIVDLVRNDLGRVCVPGGVRVPALAEVRPHAGVWHMVSEVEGELRDDVGDGGPAARDLPARLGHRRAEARRARRDRRARVDRPRGLHRLRRLREPARGPRAQRRDPHVRGARPADLARRRRRHHGRQRGGGRGARGRREGRAAARRDRRRPATRDGRRPGSRSASSAAGRGRCRARIRPPGVYETIRVVHGERAGARRPPGAAGPLAARRSTACRCRTPWPSGSPAAIAGQAARAAADRRRSPARTRSSPSRRSARSRPPSCARSSSPAGSARTSGATARCSSRTRPTTRRRSRSCSTPTASCWRRAARASSSAAPHGDLSTPPADGRILPGVTAAHAGARPRVLTLADLEAAPELYVASALRGLAHATLSPARSG